MTGIHEVAAAKPAPQPSKLNVTVSYNGVGKSFEVEPQQSVQSLLHLALKAFDIQNQPHLFALFNESNVELQDQSSLEAAGVKDHASLLLRPSAVRGGLR